MGIKYTLKDTNAKINEIKRTRKQIRSIPERSVKCRPIGKPKTIFIG